MTDEMFINWMIMDYKKYSENKSPEEENAMRQRLQEKLNALKEIK